MAAIRETIRGQVFAEAEKSVQGKVDEGVNDIRNGVVRKENGDEDKDAGFFEKIWAFLKSMIFKFAQAFGFDKWLANLCGSPIPEKTEVTALSNQVANDVSQKLTSEFKFETKAEFEKEVGGHVLNGLKANRQKYLSFNEDQLVEVAKTAAISISKQKEFAALFDASGKRIGENMYASPAIMAVANELSSTLDKAVDAKMLEKIGKLSGKPDFNKDDLRDMAVFMTPTVMEIPRGDALKNTFKTEQEKEAKFTEISGKLRQALNLNIDRMNSSGAKWYAEKTDILADTMTIEFMKKEGISTPPAFQKELDQKTSAATTGIVRQELHDKVSGGIRSKIATNVVESYDSYKGVGFGDVARAVTEFKTYHTKDSNGHYTERPDLSSYQKNELKQVQEKLAIWAGTDNWTKNNAPTTGQRELISSLVSTTLLEELKKPEVAALRETRGRLAEHMHERINAKLLANDGLINRTVPEGYEGHTIQAINENMKVNIYNDIASEIADKIRSEDKTYRGMKEAIDTFHPPVVQQPAQPAAQVASTTPAAPALPVTNVSSPDPVPPATPSGAKPVAPVAPPLATPVPAGAVTPPNTTTSLSPAEQKAREAALNPHHEPVNPEGYASTNALPFATGVAAQKGLS